MIPRRFDTVREHGARYVRAVLEHSDGNKRHACRILKITYHTLRAYLRLPLPAATPFGAETRPVTYPSIYRHLVRAASNECPKGHANALREYVKLARTLVPARGIFGPGTRDEDSFCTRIQEIGERWFGVAAAHRQLQRLTTAMTKAECGSDEIEAVQAAQVDLQKRSDTTYFYAGLAFGLVFVEYGMLLGAATPVPSDSEALARGPGLDRTPDAPRAGTPLDIRVGQPSPGCVSLR